MGVGCLQGPRGGWGKGGQGVVRGTHRCPQGGKKGWLSIHAEKEGRHAHALVAFVNFCERCTRGGGGHEAKGRGEEHADSPMGVSKGSGLSCRHGAGRPLHAGHAEAHPHIFRDSAEGMRRQGARAGAGLHSPSSHWTREEIVPCLFRVHASPRQEVGGEKGQRERVWHVIHFFMWKLHAASVALRSAGRGRKGHKGLGPGPVSPWLVPEGVGGASVHGCGWWGLGEVGFAGVRARKGNKRRHD